MVTYNLAYQYLNIYKLKDLKQLKIILKNNVNNLKYGSMGNTTKTVVHIPGIQGWPVSFYLISVTI